MSFGDIESSRDRGEPAEAYLFRYGDGDLDVFAYTDAEDALTLDTVCPSGATIPIVYEPIPIDRDAVGSDGTLDKSTVEIHTPQDVGLADLFSIYPPSQVVTLIVRQGHLNDPSSQFLVVWSGRVLGFKIENEEAIYSCEPISTSLKRSGLKRNYQYGCPHVLYGQGDGKCNASRPAATVTVATAGVTNGAVVPLAANWVDDAIKPQFAGGIAAWTTPEGRTESRTILRCNTDGTIVLGGFSPGLPAGALIALSRGCNHLMSDCGGIHHNIQNFGGQPYIPLKTPIGIRNIYY